MSKSVEAFPGLRSQLTSHQIPFWCACVCKPVKNKKTNKHTNFCLFFLVFFVFENCPFQKNFSIPPNAFLFFFFQKQILAHARVYFFFKGPKRVSLLVRLLRTQMFLSAVDYALGYNGKKTVLKKKKQKTNLEIEKELINIFHHGDGRLPTELFIFVVHQPVHGLHHLQDLFFLFFFLCVLTPPVCLPLYSRTTTLREKKKTRGDFYWNQKTKKPTSGRISLSHSQNKTSKIKQKAPWPIFFE